MSSPFRLMRWVLVFGLGFLGACTLPSDLLDNLPCPCGDGWTCNEREQVCVPQGPVDPDLGSCLVPLQEDFFDERLDEEKWSSVTDNESTVTQAGGEFIAQVPANAVSDYAFLVGRELIDVTNCAVFIELREATPSDLGITIFTLRITNSTSIGFEVVGNRLTGSSFMSGVVDVKPVDTEYDPVEHRWLAVRGDGENLYWLTSPDGLDWTVRGQRTPDFPPEGLELIFGVGSRGDNPELTSRFDNLNTPPRAE